MGYMERYEEWLKRLPEDHPFHAELIAIKEGDRVRNSRSSRDLRSRNEPHE